VRRVAIAAAILAACVTAGAAQAQGSASAFFARCKVDDEIAAADRHAAETTALALARATIAGDEVAILGDMTPAAQIATPPDKLRSLLSYVASFAPYRDLHVERTFSINVEKVGGVVPRIHCGKSASDPEAMWLSVMPSGHQIDVAISTQSRNNGWSFFVVLERDDDAWKAASFHIDGASAAGHSSRDFQKLAEAQAAKGHRINAALLYEAAIGVAERGPNAVPVWHAALVKEAAGFVLPKELARTTPLTWTAADPALGRATVALTAVAPNLALIFERHPQAWSNDAAADRDSQAFATSVISHAELSEVFSAVIVRAMRPDGSGGFGTVYEFGKGFLDHKPVSSGQ